MNSCLITSSPPISANFFRKMLPFLRVLFLPAKFCFPHGFFQLCHFFKFFFFCHGRLLEPQRHQLCILQYNCALVGKKYDMSPLFLDSHSICNTILPLATLSSNVVFLPLVMILPAPVPEVSSLYFNPLPVDVLLILYFLQIS